MTSAVCCCVFTCTSLFKPLLSLFWLPAMLLLMLLNSVYSKVLIVRKHWEMGMTDIEGEKWAMGHKQLLRNSDCRLKSIYAFASWFRLSNCCLKEQQFSTENMRFWLILSLFTLENVYVRCVTYITTDSWLWLSRESVPRGQLRLQPG